MLSICKLLWIILVIDKLNNKQMNVMTTHPITNNTQSHFILQRVKNLA